MSAGLTIAAPMSAPDRPAALAPLRYASVDLLRGLVMVLMALDHVRGFFLFRGPFDLATTPPALFLTRWITHFCAPAFVFLAGTGAYLSLARGKSRGQLAWFLFTRGLWLAFLELTVINVSWAFNFDLWNYTPGVFWALGWSMVVLAGLVYLPTALVLTFGVVMIAGHNLLDGLTAAEVGLPTLLWAALHSPGKVDVVWGITFETNWFLVPWMGVMATGYSFGALLQLDPPRRRKACFLLGVALTLAFITLRWLNGYGDPRPWAEQAGAGATVLSFLHCTKTPPSLLFLLMTLGPVIVALAIFDRPPGRLAQPLVTFGRVPLFFYLLHLPLIHLAAVGCDCARFGSSPLSTAPPWVIRPSRPPVYVKCAQVVTSLTEPDLPSAVTQILVLRSFPEMSDPDVKRVPGSYGVGLPVVYLVWIGVVLLLYLPCRWYAMVKQRHRSVWLSYF